LTIRVLQGDCRDVLKTLPTESVHCVVTSPPYWGLRDYGSEGQIGLEGSPEAFVNELVTVFGQVRRVLRADGTVWLNLGDSYASTGSGKQGNGQMASRSVAGARIAPPTSGLLPKNLVGIPWRVAFALQMEGWYLRQDIIWHKPNPMPESVTDRCTKSHEYIFLLAKSERYYYDAAAIAEPAIYAGETGCVSGPKNAARAAAAGRAPSGNERADAGRIPVGDTRNRRSVWTVTTKAYNEAHFATFPPDLIEPCILAGCPEGGTVLDPFGGAGTTGLVADRHKRDAILIELNPEYAEMARKRIFNDAPLFAEVTSA
jgi:DNA modification methylase